MLLRIPDEYKSLTEWLDRQGIPYYIETERYREVLEKRADTLNFMHVIDLSQVDLKELVDGAISYIEEITKTNKYALDHLYNESLKVSYGKLTNNPYKEAHVEK